jgi:hypothetical protein
MLPVPVQNDNPNLISFHIIITTPVGTVAEYGGKILA